jgi:RNA recognition motif-containing protein
MTIYISNLSFNVSDEQLNNVFNPFGIVTSARVVTDKFTNRSRGFGFVEMNDETEAQKAIDSLNGTLLDGRPLTVNKAKPKNSL